MMMNFKVLDLCCGAGGASFGYHLAGYDVWGVDIEKQPHYPFPFIHMDALELLQVHKSWIRDNFSLIHASPPCQHYSVLKSLHKDVVYPDLINAFRDHMDIIGLPYVIENVAGAPLHNAFRLCGTQFELRLFRHRYFELGQGGHQIQIAQLAHTSHTKQGLKAPKTSREPVYESGEVHSIYGHFSGVEGAREAMGIGWMTRDELAQAIPPAYTQYIAENMRYAVVSR